MALHLPSGRPVSQHTWRLLADLREARERREAKSPDELRAEAQAALDAMSYSSSPVTPSSELRDKLAQPI